MTAQREGKGMKESEMGREGQRSVREEVQTRARNQPSCGGGSEATGRVAREGERKNRGSVST